MQIKIFVESKLNCRNYNGICFSDKRTHQFQQSVQSSHAIHLARTDQGKLAFSCQRPEKRLTFVRMYKVFYL